MPDRARPFALGWLQALSAVGNMTAALDRHRAWASSSSRAPIGSAWRIMFVIGALPALLAISIRRRLKEPERWKAAAQAERRGGRRPAATSTKLGSISELFGDPRWRRNTIVGMLLAFAGVVGLWGIGFFSFDLIRSVFRERLRGPGASTPTQAIDGKLTCWSGITSLVQNLGGLLRHLRLQPDHRSTSAASPPSPISFVLAMVATAFTFWFLDELRRHLLDDPDHGLLPARPVRRLRHLLPRAVPDPPAEHRHVVLLQRRPARRGRRPARPSACSRASVFAGYSDDPRCRCATPA